MLYIYIHYKPMYQHMTPRYPKSWPQDTPSLPQLDDTRWHWAPTVQRPAPKSPGRRDVFSARLRGSTWPKSSASGLVGWEKKKSFPQQSFWKTRGWCNFPSFSSILQGWKMLKRCQKCSFDMWNQVYDPYPSGPRDKTLWSTFVVSELLEYSCSKISNCVFDLLCTVSFEPNARMHNPSVVQWVSIVRTNHQMIACKDMKLKLLGVTPHAKKKSF